LRGIVGLITTEELASALGIAEQTLAGWRCSGQGPNFAKLGKGVFYRLADVQTWVAASVTSVVTARGPA
jgi:predicted DNA-binding transcriptional regulator AlpA